MREYNLTIKEVEEVAKSTVAFKLEKPKGFIFKPGQHISVYNDAKTQDKHTFSIASAPHEDFIMFATRLRKSSAFKEKLITHHDGDKIKIGEPGGQFTLPKEKNMPIVFIVGGIGITPVRSMLKYAEHKQVGRTFMLFYSNRTSEDAAFLHELENINLTDYRFVPTMTNIKDSKEEWNGETGRITKALVKKYVTDVSTPIFYVVGAPGFVEAMVNLLDSMGDIPSTHIKSEDFEGY